MGRKNRSPGGISYETDAELWVSGRWDGGTVKVRDHKLCKPPLLLRTQIFAVLAVLVMRGKYDEPLPEEEEWQNRGYLTAQEIANLALRWGGVAVESRQVPRLIHELRHELAQLWDDPIKGKNWAMRLVQWKSGLGYRLSTPASKLHMHLIPDLSKSETIELPTRNGVIQF